MLGNLKAAVKFTLILLWLGFWYLWLLLAFKLKKWTWRDRIMRISSGGILRLIGIRITATGQVSDIRPLLMVSNHCSYLDVWILNTLAAVHFTPKAEIAKWPVISSICRCSGAIFVDRRPEKLKESKEAITSALAQGKIICLFPEATTGNGIHILPFKSGFFSLAEDKIGQDMLSVQPVAVTYNSIRHLPIDKTQWPLIAWYGDMVLMPHFWNLLKITPIDAEVIFLPTVTIKQSGDRKKLAEHCRNAIDEAIQSTRSRHRHVPVKPSRFHPRFLRLKK